MSAPLRSVWHERAATAIPPAPPSLPDAVDVAVVGAGVTGLSTAAMLVDEGLSVAVLEARSIAAGTTGGSTAKVSLLQGTRLSEIARRHPASTLRHYVQANRDAQEWLAEICRSAEVPTQRRAAVTYAIGERGERAARQECVTACAAGVPARWVNDLDLPFATRGGVLLDDQFQTDPVALSHALARRAREGGAAIHERVRVRRVHGSRPSRVETSAGDLLADVVILATGMPILDRGAFFARMEPRRSYTLAFRTPMDEWTGMYLSADQPSRSLRDLPDGQQRLLLVGGAGHVTGRTRSERHHLDRLRAWTRAWWPQAEETHAWSAQDHTTAHQLPFAGPLLPGADHLLVAGGFAKWGMTNGVASALALSAHISGRRASWADALTPWHTSEIRGVTELVRANARIGLELAKGWIRPVDVADESGNRIPDDETRRLSRVCSHLGGRVRWNDAERSWDCPLHGSRFDEDGAVLEAPATCGLRRD